MIFDVSHAPPYPCVEPPTVSTEASDSKGPSVNVYRTGDKRNQTDPNSADNVLKAVERKGIPLCTGVLDYFPDALAEVARVSVEGNKQHNPGEPLHWAKGKSTDHADSLMRHLKDRGKIDSDGRRHSGKLAWRALALLQTEIEDENK